MGKRKETEIFTREDADRLLEAAENRDAVTVPEGVTVIDRHAFSGRAEIRRVTLPETVTAILDGIRLPFGLEKMERWWNDGDGSFCSIFRNGTKRTVPIVPL